MHHVYPLLERLGRAQTSFVPLRARLLLVAVFQQRLTCHLRRFQPSQLVQPWVALALAWPRPAHALVAPEPAERVRCSAWMMWVVWMTLGALSNERLG